MAQTEATLFNPAPRRWSVAKVVQDVSGRVLWLPRSIGLRTRACKNLTAKNDELRLSISFRLRTHTGNDHIHDDRLVPGSAVSCVTRNIKFSSVGNLWHLKGKRMTVTLEDLTG